MTDHSSSSQIYLREIRIKRILRRIREDRYPRVVIETTNAALGCLLWTRCLRHSPLAAEDAVTSLEELFVLGFTTRCVQSATIDHYTYLTYFREHGERAQPTVVLMEVSC